MSTSQDRWTCPHCHQTTHITGNVEDTAAAIKGVQHRHANHHARQDRTKKRKAPAK